MPQYKYIGTVLEAIPIMHAEWLQKHDMGNCYERYILPEYYVKYDKLITPPNFLAEATGLGRIDMLDPRHDGDTVNARVYGNEIKLELGMPIYQRHFFVTKEEKFLLAARKINKLIKRLKKAGSKEVAHQLKRTFDDQFDTCINGWGQDTRDRGKKRLIAFQRELYRTFPDYTKDVEVKKA